MLTLHTLLADTPLSEPSALPAPVNGHPDPLIDQGGQITVYIGSALIAMGIVAVVGFFSRRIEHALITAFALSFCLVLFFAFTR
jgi:hypothetical protein